jgi:hypothetical protein
VDLVATTDLNAFREAAKGLDRGSVERLQDELTKATGAEPTRLQLQQGVPLVDRMQTPATVLLRQIRLEKLRILAELLDSPRSPS